MAMTSMTGGCLCGQVRYTVNSDPLVSTICHCRDCQRFTGSAFVELVRVPADSANVVGELKAIDATGGSGNIVRRHFCANCSSPVFVEVLRRPGMINLMVGTLDDPSIFAPTREIFCDYAQPWFHAGGERERLPRGV
jgi:hypothetical protein